jgi:hypothetical protein
MRRSSGTAAKVRIGWLIVYSVVQGDMVNAGSVVRDGLIDAYRLSINPSLGEVPFQGTSFRSVTSERSPTKYECTLAKDQKSL